MALFARRTRTPKLVAESDPGRQELLRSQLDVTMRYGWGDQTAHDGREFFDSLGPVSDPAHLVETLNRRG